MPEKNEYASFEVRWDFEQELCLPEKFREPLPIGSFLRSCAASGTHVLRLSEYAKWSSMSGVNPELYCWTVWSNVCQTKLVIDCGRRLLVVDFGGLAQAMVERAASAHAQHGGCEDDLLGPMRQPPESRSAKYSTWVVLHRRNAPLAVVVPLADAGYWLREAEAGHRFPYG